MDFTYKTATLEDIDILVTTRIEVLRPQISWMIRQICQKLRYSQEIIMKKP